MRRPRAPRRASAGALVRVLGHRGHVRKRPSAAARRGSERAGAAYARRTSGCGRCSRSHRARRRSSVAGKRRDRRHESAARFGCSRGREGRADPRASSAAATTSTRCAGRTPAPARAATCRRSPAAGRRRGPKTYLPLTTRRSSSICAGGSRSASIRCSRTTPAGFSPATSTAGRGNSTRSRCSRRALSAGCRRRWSGAAPASGGHVWVFFSAPVAAGSARRLGALLLRDAMTRRGRARPRELRPALPEPGLPAAEGVRQPDRAAAAGPLPRRRHERLPRSGDVRALARPVGVPRARSSGSTPERLEQLLAEHERRRRRLGGARRRTSRRGGTSGCRRRCAARSAPTSRSHAPLLPPSLLAELKHLASLHNPLFYERQRCGSPPTRRRG